ncbi:thiamine/thiamine pyrophosphate ABC transporter permease ThiP [Pikeienuella sp. HZG-20]|uniref:thiamine/thiamine pyrophosphate ABC transporter permease ThiP n=1 Tax=Paludibacillus litoralis TaxID=3133267 RepID=UPI0030EF53C8
MRPGVDRRRLHPAVLLFGGGALAFALALTFGAVAVLALAAAPGGGISAPDWRAFRFTALQAFLSALLSVLLAAPLARALARRRFRGREAVLSLLGAPFLLPVIVAIFGVVAIWGRSGLVSQALLAAGFGRLDIYGLPGILIAHVFFNLPLATRLLLQGWAEIPAERWRLAAQLGVEGRALFRLLEWPALRATAPGAFALIFLICATSFAVALALGGGPRATTLELAIYQAMRYDFDLARAAELAGLQFALCLALALFAARVSAPAGFGPGLGAAPRRWDGRRRAARMMDGAVILLALLFLGSPIAAAIAQGLPGLTSMGAGIWAAAGRSLIVAPLAAAIALLLALALAAFITGLERRRPEAGRLAEALGLLTLAVSPFVVGVALFITLRPMINPASAALPLIALVNAMMALPFALRLLLPPLREAVRDYGPLAASLGMTGGALARLVYLPRLRRPLGFAAGLSAALAMGDLGVVALFSAPGAPTLPLYMYGLMAAHRLEAAAGAALLLAGLSFGLFIICDQWGRHAET